MTVQEALAIAIAALKEAGIEDAPRDARRLMAATLGLEPGRLTLHLPDAVDPLDETTYFAAIKERQARRPMSHLLGYRDFYGRRFNVSSDVLDPRGDTETLIEAALSEPFEHVLDLGTGSGCILVTLLAEFDRARGVGTDVSDAALEIAAKNAGALGVAARCEFMRSDWFAHVTGRYDLIVSNPPYISAEEMGDLQPELAHEPREALTDEGDGLSAYRAITAQAGAFLAPNGRLLVEIGSAQGQAVAKMVRQAGFGQVTILQDLDGHDRVVWGRWPG